MPTQAKSPRRYVAVAVIAGVLALAGTFAFPGVGRAQTEQTTTTVVEEPTETTVPSDESTDETRLEGGDGNCDRAEYPSTPSDA